MKNFEKYMDEILSFHESYINSGIAIVDGKPKVCDEIPCLVCEFNDGANCEYQLIEWLYEEADSDTEESEQKEVNKEVNNDNTKSCKDCRHTYKKENEEPCINCRNRYILKFEPKLKPCPYCGGKAKEEEIGRDWNIVCENCQSSIKPYPTPKEAMEAWNRRRGE